MKKILASSICLNILTILLVFASAGKIIPVFSPLQMLLLFGSVTLGQIVFFILALCKLIKRAAVLIPVITMIVSFLSIVLFGHLTLISIVFFNI